MSDENDFGTAHSLPTSGTHCGLRPNKKAMQEGFSVNFSEAKKLLEENSPDDSSDQHLDSKPPQLQPTDIV
ncbi:MAG: hypothetical protein V7785_18120 [Bermanella sp.]